MAQPFYITTPIYYPSDYLHIGHCYTTVAADVVSRYKRMQGYDVYFLTGTDEHGEKIARKAAEKGVSPQEYVDTIVCWIKELWERLHISYDQYIRTTDAKHKKGAQNVFQKLYDQGDIYKGTYEGYYSVSEEAYFPKTQIFEREGKFYAENLGRELELEVRREEVYFLRLSKYQDWIREYLETTPDFLLPRERVTEMVNNFLAPGLEDLAVTRTTVSWGVPVPFDNAHTIYVWFEALLNYVTALGYMTGEDDGLFKKFWPANVHLMAKEIVRFHSIVWPIMLKMLGLPLPNRLFGHGWILFDNDKMSKSKGNVVTPTELADRYGVDAIRYFLMREMRYGADGNYTQELFLRRFNSDLSNDLGNLFQRALAMTMKYNDGMQPAADERAYVDEDRALKDSALALREKTEAHLNEFRFSNALDEVFAVIAQANRYIEQRAPWALAKDASKKSALMNALHIVTETLRIVGTLLRPFLIDTTAAMFERLAIPAPEWNSASQWPMIPEGTRFKEGPPLFPRVDIEKEVGGENAPAKKNLKRSGKTAGISFAEFEKLDICVAKILTAEPVDGADALLRLTLDLGEGETRAVVSGIKAQYRPNDLIGKSVVYLSNLAPRKIRGIESEGMILAAEDEGTISLLVPDRAVGEGAKVR